MELKIQRRKTGSPQEKTSAEFDQVVAYCRSLFEKKTRDYGTAWRILRLPSLTDQVFIKARRIRSIQENGINKVGDSLEGEFVGILNYAVMALIQLHLKDNSDLELPTEVVLDFYDKEATKTKELLFAKNHDYGEAWRDMRIASMVDLILMKLLRTKQIEDNNGKTLVSEGVEANYRDMVNYSIFCLIRMATDQE